MINVTKEEFAEAMFVVNSYTGDTSYDQDYLDAKIKLCTQFLKRNNAFPERTYVKILKKTDDRPAMWVEVKDASKMSEYLINKDSIKLK